MNKKINHYVSVIFSPQHPAVHGVLRKLSEENTKLSPKMSKLNINKEKLEVKTPNVELKGLNKQALNLSSQILKLETKASKQKRGIKFLNDLIKNLRITYSALVRFLEKNQYLNKRFHFDILKCQAKPRKLSAHQQKGMPQPEALKAYQESKKKKSSLFSEELSKF